jgi:hypothetical protein
MYARLDRACDGSFYDAKSDGSCAQRLQDARVGGRGPSDAVFGVIAGVLGLIAAEVIATGGADCRALCYLFVDAFCC